jgi:hypothetical protein
LVALDIADEQFASARDGADRARAVLGALE